MRNPVDRLLQRLPHRTRLVADWLITVAFAVVVVLAIRAWVISPFRIPTPSMEPTLHCAPISAPHVPTVSPPNPSSLPPSQTSTGATSSTTATASTATTTTTAPSTTTNEGKPLPTNNPSDASANGCLGSCIFGLCFSDRVLVNRLIYHFRSPRRGEIIVFKTPPKAALKCGVGGDYVKRLVGLPGETLREKQGFMYVNGRKLPESYIKPAFRDTLSGGPWHVPKGQYFFMGDNRFDSCDSRQWGSVPGGNLIGEVFMTYWPPDRISFR
ncbi:MAG: signal peptidase I [Gaiellaceae bacterium]